MPENPLFGGAFILSMPSVTLAPNCSPTVSNSSPLHMYGVNFSNLPWYGLFNYENSLRRNGIPFYVEANYQVNVIQGIAYTPDEQFTFCLDVVDDAALFDFSCLFEKQYYFKTSFSSALLQRMILTPEYSRMANYTHKIFAVPITRQNGGGEAPSTRCCKWPPRKHLIEATTILTSYSRGTSQVHDARMRLYRLIMKESSGNPALADFYVTHSEPPLNNSLPWTTITDFYSKHLPPGCGQVPGYFENECYYPFLKKALFLLNLQGIGLSMPFRILDACDTDTGVVTDAFFADAFIDFPFYRLSFNSHGNSSVTSIYDQKTHFRLPWPGLDGESNETALKEELRILFEDPMLLRSRLLPVQRHWCRAHYSEEAFIHTLFKHFKGAPFKHFLRAISDDVLFRGALLNILCIFFSIYWSYHSLVTSFIPHLFIFTAVYNNTC